MGRAKRYRKLKRQNLRFKRVKKMLLAVGNISKETAKSMEHLTDSALAVGTAFHNNVEHILRYMRGH